MAASANPSGNNQDQSSTVASSAAVNGNSDKSGLKHVPAPGISTDWTPEKITTLEEGLAKYSTLSPVLRYAKIAQTLPKKTVRDVALRCRYTNKKEISKRRKDEPSRKSKDKKYPFGIDFQRFVYAFEIPTVQDYMVYLKQCFAGRKVILGVDRLDMIKGIPEKLLAFERFLEENIYWRDKVVLIQIAVPSRTDVPKYQRLASQVHEIVGRINGRFGILTSLPVHHLDCSLDFHALCSLYAITDVALVTPLRDGMNPVSYEFVACQASKKGVLILSEFAGAAQSLGAGSILVNPWNIMEVATAIAYALHMPTDEREKRHQYNYNYVKSHTSQKWAEIELNDTMIEAQCQTTQIQPALPAEVVIRKFIQSDNRLLIFGFNATLTQSVEIPGERVDQIKEMELKLHPDMKEPLRRLCNEPNTTVLIISGSTRTVLDNNFDEFDVCLAAENGVFLRHTSGNWMTTLPESSNMEWVEAVEHVFEYFTDRTPGSLFESRETSLVWNYKYADVEFGRLQAKDLLQHLVSGTISSSVFDVFQGSHTVEVRATGHTGCSHEKNNRTQNQVTYRLCTL